MEQPNEPELTALNVEWIMQAAEASWIGRVQTNYCVREDISTRVDKIPQTSFFLLQIIWRCPGETSVETWGRISLASENVRTLMHTASLWIVQIVMGAVNAGVGSRDTIPPTLRQDLDNFFAGLQGKEAS